MEEILRCAQTAFGQIRTSKNDTELLGHRIPKGTDVFCLSNGPSTRSGAPFTIDEKLRSESSRDAKDRTGVWDVTDMGVFMPERWLKQSEKGEEVFDSRAGPSIPFGLGPRGCFGESHGFWSAIFSQLPAAYIYADHRLLLIGRKLAEMELHIILVLLVWNFEFQPTPAELNSYKAVDKLTHQPQQCFVRLALAK